MVRYLGRRPVAGVARVVEADELLEAREHAVVQVGLHEIGVGTGVHVAQRRHLVLAEFILGVVLEAFGGGEEAAEAGVDVILAVGVELLGQRIEGQVGIPGRAQVVVREVGEQGRFAQRTGPAGMAVGAESLALEDLQAELLLGRQLDAAHEVEVVLGTEGVDLGRPLVGGDRQRDQVEGVLGVLGIQGSGAEHRVETVGVRRQTQVRDDCGGVREVLLQRIQERRLRLFGDRVAEEPAVGATVEEHAADEHLFRVVPVQDRAVADVGGRRRLAVAEPCGDGARVDAGHGVDVRIGAGETGVRTMAGGAGLAGRLGQGLVEEDRLAERLDRRQFGGLHGSDQQGSQSERAEDRAQVHGDFLQVGVSSRSGGTALSAGQLRGTLSSSMARIRRSRVARSNGF